MVKSNAFIKELLLKEAKDRLSRVKKGQIEKAAMGLYSGQGDILNSNNTSYSRVSMDEESRIGRIKAAIEESFGRYLRTRLVDPLTGQRATRLTPMSPGVGEQLSSGEGVSLLDETILAIDKPADLEFDSGFQPGHLYFRYEYTRDILPTRNPDHLKRANGFLAHYHELTNQTVPGGGQGGLCPSCGTECAGDVCPTCQSSKSQPQNIGFVNFAAIIRCNNIALLAPFNTRNAGNDPSAIPPSLARQFIATMKNAQPIMVQSPYNRQKQLFANIDLSILRYGEEEREIPYTVGKTGSKKVLIFSNNTIDLHDHLEKPSELNRQVFWKICSGYTLDEARLDDTIARYIDEHMKHFPSGKDDRFLKTQQQEWKQSKRIMLNVFRTMEKRAPTEFKRAMSSWYGTNEPVPSTSDYVSQDKPPTEGLNYQHGMPFYGSSKLLRCYVTEEGGEVCINFRSLHLKMLLLNCTTPKPENYSRSITVKSGARGDKEIRPDTYFPLPGPDEFIEPRYTVKSIPDGMSDPLNPRMAQAGLKEMGIPPLIKVPSGEPGGFEARLDRHNINLGRKHLMKSGPGIMALLEWAEQTDWPRKAMSQLDEAHRAGGMHDEAAEVYRVLSEGTFGSDVFQYYMDMYGSDPQSFFDQHLRQGLNDVEDREYGTEEASEFRVNNRSLGLLKKHGPAISALMDILYALMHRASSTSVKIQDKSGETRTLNTFGQQYDGTSGAGGGGQVLLSIKFAYEAKIEQLGSPEATKRWKQNIPGNDPRILQKDVLLRQTDPVNLGNEPTMQELDEGAEPDMLRPHIIQHLSFWVGQSSSLNRGGGQRHSRMTTLWPRQGFQGKSWAEALDYFYLRYPQIGEDTGEVIFDIGINLANLERRLTESFEKVRQELELENPVILTTEFGTEELGAFPIAAREREFKPGTEPIEQPMPPVTEAPVEPALTTVSTPEQAAPAATTPPPPASEEPKPMYQAPSSGYIGKPDNKRTLIKSRNRMHAETLVSRISKIATQFDNRGEQELADIFDLLLLRITKEETAAKANRV